jgi:lysophospholipase L1-like esterase
LQKVGGYISWFEKRGMRWDEFNKFIDLTLRKSPPPSFIIIQLGSNDLGLTKSWQLFTDIECDLLRLRALQPDVIIIWSDILQRRYWHNATDGKAMERTHKRVNLLVRNLVLSFGGCVIRHCNIRAREINLFRNDGTHLSKLGIDIYLNNIQGALERFLAFEGSLVSTLCSPVKIVYR